MQERRREQKEVFSRGEDGVFILRCLEFLRAKQSQWVTLRILRMRVARGKSTRSSYSWLQLFTFPLASKRLLLEICRASPSRLRSSQRAILVISTSIVVCESVVLTIELICFALVFIH